MTVSEFNAAVETVLAVAFWGSLLVLLLRFPGRTMGVGVALALWPAVGPWASWLALGVTVVGALVWRHAGPDEQYGLFATPELAVLVAAGAVAVLAGGTAARVALLVLVGVGGWLAATWLPRINAAVKTLRRLVAGGLRRAVRLVRPTVALVRCEHCAGDVVVVAHPEAVDGVSSSEVAARGACSNCGARWVGVSDPAGSGQVLWSPLPAGAAGVRLSEGSGS